MRPQIWKVWTKTKVNMSYNNIFHRLTENNVVLPEMVLPQPQSAQNTCDEWFTIENATSDKSLKLALEIDVALQVSDFITLEISFSLRHFISSFIMYKYCTGLPIHQSPRSPCALAK